LISGLFRGILNLHVSKIYCRQGTLFQDNNLRMLEMLKFIRQTELFLNLHKIRNFEILGICKIPREV